MRFRGASGSILLSTALYLLIFCSCNSAGDSNRDKSDAAGATFTYAVVNVNIADLKKEPERRAERVSQAFYDEAVEVLDRNDGYCRIRQRDGYEGWIRSYYLDESDDFQGNPGYIVIVALAEAYERPDYNSARKTLFPYGSGLSGDITGRFLRIESTRYGTVYAPLSDLEKIDSYTTSLEPDSANICREAGKFIGSPYLWGGKSFFGIDCSGLTQVVMKRFGVDLHRDSKDQMTQGREVPRDSVRAGDLLFFPHHVGLAVTRDLMVHSTGRNGGVAFNSLDPESPIYSEYHDKNFIMARRVLN